MAMDSTPINVSTPVKVRWQKVPISVREKIKEKLSVHDLSEIRQFSLSYTDKPGQVQGYARSTLLNTNLNLEVLIQSGESFSRCTMQRMSRDEPFTRLI